MASSIAPNVPMGEGQGSGAPDAAVQRNWPKAERLSSLGDAAERFLGDAGFDRAPWLAVAFASGIATWFVLDSPWQWVAAVSTAVLVSLFALATWRGNSGRANLMVATIGVGAMFAAGIVTVWSRSETVGAVAIDRPEVTWITGRILEREEQPSQQRVRLVLATRDAASGTARKVRVNVPADKASSELAEDAVVRLRARLMPPASPMLPGSYDFARTAWFEGLSATGSIIGDVEVIESAQHGGWLAQTQRSLAAHVRDHVGGSAGTIAAALASGDRGAIAERDEDAMRDAGLTHLLSISGLHVSAVIAAAYLLALKLLALWPWLTLRVRLPVIAAALGALAGIGYTLLTGSEVPTVRSCVAATLVLIALALGRDPLSLRMVAVAAIAVLIVWPESLAGPSFQMSFSAVIAIVALHNSEPVKRFLAPREERWLTRAGRRTIMLLLTGLVIEIALMPIVLFHFHRAGVYGALANVLAIPLVTFVSMPAIALSLVLDTIGLGGPAWWVSEKSLELLLAIAHFTAEQPGAVKLMPQMGYGTFALFLTGGLWLALWRGRARLFGFVPAAIATGLLLITPVPDLLVSSDGRHVGIAGEGDRLLMLRESRSDYALDNLMELAGMEGEPIALSEWSGAECSRDFCVTTLERDGKAWTILMARSRERIEERALAAACEQSDIVIADRWLPASCNPKWLKADRQLLSRTGGLSIYLEDERFETVASSQGEHGWWRGERE